jgi:hypothetical protein
MMTHSYPRIGQCTNHSNWLKRNFKCRICGEQALYESHIEYDYFRGDDEVVKTCKEHSRDLTALVEYIKNKLTNAKESK